MLPVNGLYGHIRRNAVRSVVLFGGFLIAFQLLAAVVLFLPLAIFDPGHAPVYAWGGYAARYLLPVLLLAVLLFAVQFLWHVSVITRSNGVVVVGPRQEPRLFALAEPLAITAGLQLPKLGVIESPSLNAFACGFNRQSAMIVVTRGLLQGLDDEELETVLAHEMSHIVGGDIRMLAVAGVLQRNLFLLQTQNPIRINSWKQVLLFALIPAFLPLMLAGGLLSQLALYGGNASRRLISTAREYIADAESVRLTLNPAALISALRRIEGNSALATVRPEFDAMMLDGEVRGRLATHPAIPERIAAIERLTGGMAFIAPTRRDTRDRAPPPLAALASPDRPLAPPPPQSPALAAVTSADRALGAFVSGAPKRRFQPIYLLAIIPATWPFLFLWWLWQRSKRASASLQPEAAAAPTLSELLSKDAAVERDLLGLTPQTRKLVLVGIVAMFALYGSRIGSLADAREMFDIRAMTNAFRGMVTPSGEAPGVVAGAAPSDAVIGRQAVKAVANRCYMTDRYTVGDRRLYDVNEAEQVSRNRGSFSIYRLEDSARASPRDLAALAPAERDAALKAYVEGRRVLQWVAHRFYGEPGLARLQQVYAGEANDRMLSALRARLGDADFRADLTPRQLAEMTLLAEAPGDFVPCQARGGVIDSDDAERTAIVASAQCYVPEHSGLRAAPVRSIDDESQGFYDGISIKHYMRTAEASIRPLTGLSAAARDKALIDYVAFRTITQTAAQHYYGAPGLARIQQVYAGPQNDAMLAALRERMSDTAFRAQLDPVQIANIGLLTRDPQRFVPCAPGVPAP